jgi:aspartyl-tRNA(Asn)/glutamyl-tRNA(Gln) amidotransferase subunit C
MKITKAEVQHVAKLARLDVRTEEIERFADQIGTVLEYVDTLKEVHTEGVPATSHAITLTNAFREDVVQGQLNQEAALENAPEKSDGAFVVPKVL